MTIFQSIFSLFQFEEVTSNGPILDVVFHAEMFYCYRCDDIAGDGETGAGDTGEGVVGRTGAGVGTTGDVSVALYIVWA
jgi:hypothetical protein